MAIISHKWNIIAALYCSDGRKGTAEESNRPKILSPAAVFSDFPLAELPVMLIAVQKAQEDGCRR
jgi:hypothetical protein